MPTSSTRRLRVPWLARAAPAARPARARLTLARRYTLMLCGTALALLLASSAWDAWFGYREARLYIAQVQSTDAAGAAREIEHYLGSLDEALRVVAALPWGMDGFGPDRRRVEFYRLMRLQPAVTDLQVIDPAGRERLAVSMHETDRIDSLRPFEEPALLAPDAARPVRYGRTFRRAGQSPAVRMAVSDGANVIVATVDLRLLGGVVSHLRVGRHEVAYIVDAGDILIAHQRATEVLRSPDLSKFGPVRRARAASWPDDGTLALDAATDLQGQPVIATAARIAAPDWLLIVEQPRDEALRPVAATLGRTALLALFGGLAALAIGMISARRMARPIVALRRATERIAEGGLDLPIDADREDEIGDLARDFGLMAERLRQSYASLEQKVTDRTIQLSEARDALAQRAAQVDQLNAQLVAQLGQLADRRDEAERANAAKTRFLATASHDLRQPMHSVGLLVSALHERVASVEAIAIADKALAAVSTMEDLFGCLLDISKLDAGAVLPEIGDVPLRGVFMRIEQIWAPQAAERGLRLVVRPTALVARTDEALIERIVGNLVSNAIRYTGRGGVLVAARRRGDRIALQVWDTGPGIAERHRAAIFEEFFRIEPSSAGKAAGLGLGLSIVQRSARILEHDLSVESRVGTGSRFEVLLPCVGVGAAAVPERPAVPGGEVVAGAFVLVADDDEGNRHALASLLQSWGCHVLAVASTDEALERSPQHLRVPDLIVTDLQLGRGDDGVRLARALRGYHDEPVPVIVLTAEVHGAAQGEIAALGARLLHKPVGATRLLLEMLQAMAPATSG